MNRFAGDNIGGHDAERNFHLSEISRGCEFVEKMLEALVGRHAHARKRPAAEIAESRFGALALHFVERRSAGIGGGDQRANAGAGDDIDGDLVLFQDAKHADVRNAAREAAAEREADFRATAFLGIREGAQAIEPPYSAILLSFPILHPSVP